MRRYFVIIGNGRTGSTWLASSLNRLGDVHSGRELKWRSTTYEVRPVHYVVGIGDSSLATVLEAIHDAFLSRCRACGGVGAGGRPAMLGSKLILDPVQFYGPQVFREMAGFVGAGDPVILLRRDYLDCLKSWKARGVFHRISRKNDLSDHYFDGYDAEYTVGETAGLPDHRPIILEDAAGNVLYRDGALPPGALRYAILDAFDDLFQAFCNDIHLLDAFRARERLYLLSYEEIEPAFPDIVRFLGSTASPLDAAEILRDPSTERLPVLDDRVFVPHAALRAASDALRACFAGFAVSRSGADAVWRWSPDGRSAVIRVPGLREIVAPHHPPRAIRWWGRGFGRNDELRWVLRKPVLAGAAGA